MLGLSISLTSSFCVEDELLVPEPPAPVTITALVPPAIGRLFEGQSIEDVAGYASMTRPENFVSTQGKIESVQVIPAGTAPSVSTALDENQTFGFSVRVTDSTGAERVFATALGIVEYAVEIEQGVDSTLTIEINSLVPETTPLPVTITSEPWASRGTFPVNVTKNDVLEGPINLVAPLVIAPSAPDDPLAFAPGLWTYDTAMPEPEVRYTLQADGLSLAGYEDVGFAVLQGYTLAASELGKAIALVETVTDLRGSRQARSAAVQIGSAPSNPSSPSTLTDTFERADQPLAASPDWTAPLGGFNIVGNTLVSEDGNENIATYTGAVANDQYAQAAILTWGSRPQVIVRFQDNANFYALRWRTTNAVQLMRVEAGSESLIANLGSVAQVPGDILRLEARRTTLRGFVNGAQIGPDQTDSTFASGAIGLRSDRARSTFGSFEGGAL